MVPRPGAKIRVVGWLVRHPSNFVVSLIMCSSVVSILCIFMLTLIVVSPVTEKREIVRNMGAMPYSIVALVTLMIIQSIVLITCALRCVS